MRKQDQDLEEHRTGKAALQGFAANQIGADLAVLAVNLVSWMQLVFRPTGRAAEIWDMKRWRYQLFSVGGKLTSSARQRRLLVHRAAPEANLFTALIEGNTRLQYRWPQRNFAA